MRESEAVERQPRVDFNAEQGVSACSEASGDSEPVSPRTVAPDNCTALDSALNATPVCPGSKPGFSYASASQNERLVQATASLDLGFSHPSRSTASSSSNDSSNGTSSGGPLLNHHNHGHSHTHHYSYNKHNQFASTSAHVPSAEFRRDSSISERQSSQSSMSTAITEPDLERFPGPLDKSEAGKIDLHETTILLDEEVASHYSDQSKITGRPTLISRLSAESTLISTPTSTPPTVPKMILHTVPKPLAPEDTDPTREVRYSPRSSPPVGSELMVPDLLVAEENVGDAESAFPVGDNLPKLVRTSSSSSSRPGLDLDFSYRLPQFVGEQFSVVKRTRGEYVLPAPSGLWRDAAPPLDDLVAAGRYTVTEAMDNLVATVARVSERTTQAGAERDENDLHEIGHALRILARSAGIAFGAVPAMAHGDLAIHYRLVVNSALEYRFFPQGKELEHLVENALNFVEEYEKFQAEFAPEGSCAADLIDAYKVAYLNLAGEWVEVMWDQDGAPLIRAPLSHAPVNHICALETCDMRLAAPGLLAANLQAKIAATASPGDDEKSLRARCRAAVMLVGAFDFRPFLEHTEVLHKLFSAKEMLLRALLNTTTAHADGSERKAVEREAVVRGLSIAISALSSLHEVHMPCTAAELDSASPHEPVLDSKGQIRGGTRQSLIAEITRHDQRRPEATAAFLLTFPAFMTPLEVVALLRERFNTPPPSMGAGTTAATFETWRASVQLPIRIRVVKVLKTWLETYWSETEVAVLPELSRALASFVSELEALSFPGSASLSQLVALRQAGIATEVRRTSTSTVSVHAAEELGIHAVGELALEHVPPLEIARQLTLRKFGLYCNVSSRECLWRNFASSEASESEGAVAALVDNWNHETQWISLRIMSGETPAERASTIELFIDVANHCLSLNNFSTMMAVIAALYSAGVHRLKQTWAIVDPSALTVLDALCKIMNSSRNFTEYRNILSLVSEPAVPFIGMALMDLRFTIDGNAEHLDNDPNLINFGKWLACARIIDDALRFQRWTYPLETLPEVQDLLQGEIAVAPSLDDQYDISLLKEPRRRR